MQNRIRLVLTGVSRILDRYKQFHCFQVCIKVLDSDFHCSRISQEVSIVEVSCGQNIMLKHAVI